MFQKKPQNITLECKTIQYQQGIKDSTYDSSKIAEYTKTQENTIYFEEKVNHIK